MNQASSSKSNKQRWLIAVVLLLLVAAGAFMWFSPVLKTQKISYETVPAALGNVTSSVEASGTVRAAHSALLVWKTDGTVDQVHFNSGDVVKKDQILASLSINSVSRGIILARADLLEAEQNLKDLIQSNISQAQALQDLADAKQTVQDAQDTYDYLTRKRVTAELIEDTADQIEQAQDQVKRLEFFYANFYARRPDGASDKASMVLQITNARQNVADLVAKYNWYTSVSDPREVEKSLANLNLAKARQDDAQREYNRLKDGPTQDDIRAAQAKVAAAQATLNQAQIQAPFDGTITSEVPQPGDKISTGQAALRVDDLSSLMVDLQISEVDINTVDVGQPVIITMEAVPDKSYEGIVSRVDLSAATGQGGVNFLVSITLTNPDDQVKPGMTASVKITTRQVEAALLIPNGAIRMLDGERVVYILKTDQAIPINVRLGASANDFSQVVNGNLKAGDLIIMNPPRAAALPTVKP